MKLVVDFDRDPDDVLIASAQRIHAELFQPPRASPMHRRKDAGMKRAAGGGTNTENGFIKRRRAALDARTPVVARDTLTAIDSLPLSASIGAWTEAVNLLQ